MEIDSPENMMRHIRFLKNEVERLKKSLRTTELQREWPLIPSELDGGFDLWRRRRGGGGAKGIEPHQWRPIMGGF